MTPLAATASAAPLLLSLLGTAVMLCFVLRPALSQERKLWKALRGLAPRAAALLGVALLVLFVQIGGSLNKDAPERDGFAPILDNADTEQLVGANRDSSASAICRNFGMFWSQHHNRLGQNFCQMMFIHKARVFSDGEERPRVRGFSNQARCFSCVFVDKCASQTIAGEVAAHEIGHLLGLKNSVFRHVDSFSAGMPSHDGLDNCLMSYDRVSGEGHAELCTNCLWTTSNEVGGIRQNADR